MSSTGPSEWFAFSVTVPASAAEAVEFAFNEIDAVGTEINQLRKGTAEDVTVVGYLLEEMEDDSVREAVANGLTIYGFSGGDILEFEKRRILKTDWLLDWKKFWKPTEIGKFIVSPPWEEVSAPDKLIIWIEPNMAFGTGTHATTQLCLAAIEANYTPEMSMLDVGTGTGILAIGAALMGNEAKGSSIVGCDTDEGSIVIARENAALNEIADRVTFYDGSIGDTTEPADFVCANLTIDVILPLLDRLIGLAKSKVILSGILAEQEQDILAALSERGFSAPVVTRSGEWIAVLVAK